MDKARIKEIETRDGHHYINGRFRGFKYKRQWEVIVIFDDEDEAEAYRKRLEQRRMK